MTKVKMLTGFSHSLLSTVTTSLTFPDLDDPTLPPSPATNSDKIFELKVHSRFKEVGRDAQGGIAGAAAIAVPRRKDF